MVFLEGSCLPSALLFELLQCGCCVKCCLRLAGVQSRALYKSPDEDALDAIEKCAKGNADWLKLVQAYRATKLVRDPATAVVVKTESTTEAPTEAPTEALLCPLCLGILQNCVTKESSSSGASSSATDAVASCRVAEDLVKQVKEKGYVIKDYVLSLSLPSSCCIRAHAMWHHLGTAHASKFVGPSDAKELGAAENASDVLEHIMTQKEGGEGKRVDESSTTISAAVLEKLSRHRNQVLGLKDVVRSLVNEFVPKLLPGVMAKVLTNGECQFTVHLSFEHDTCDVECQAMNLPIEKAAKNRKRRRSGLPDHPVPTTAASSVIAKHVQAAAEKGVHVETRSGHTIPCPPTCIPRRAATGVKCSRTPHYIMGKYCKYIRGLPQTPFWVGTTRYGDRSVEEALVETFVPAFSPSSYKFHTGGREDFDVRMLGEGRPFCIELVDARVIDIAAGKYEEMMQEFNTKHDEELEVNSLRSETQESFSLLQSQAEDKRKCYVCVVWVSKPVKQEQLDRLNATTDMAIEQKTPVRVLHRRTLMTRTRLIHSMKCEYVNKHYIIVRLISSSGTYIKEFVHGDMGRTVPNLGTLLDCQADILQLDVEALSDNTAENVEVADRLCRSHQPDRKKKYGVAQPDNGITDKQKLKAAEKQKASEEREKARQAK